MVRPAIGALPSPASLSRTAVTVAWVNADAGRAKCEANASRNARSASVAYRWRLPARCSFAQSVISVLQCEAGFLLRRRGQIALSLILGLRLRPLGRRVDTLCHPPQAGACGGAGLFQRDSAPGAQRLAMLPAGRAIGPLDDEHPTASCGRANPKPPAFGIEDQTVLGAGRGAECLQECIGQLRHRPLQFCGPRADPAGRSAVGPHGVLWRPPYSADPIKARNMAAFGDLMVACGGRVSLTLNQRAQGSSPCAPTNDFKKLSCAAPHRARNQRLPRSWGAWRSRLAVINSAQPNVEEQKE